MFVFLLMFDGQVVKFESPRTGTCCTSSRQIDRSVSFSILFQLSFLHFFTSSSSFFRSAAPWENHSTHSTASLIVQSINIALASHRIVNKSFNFSTLLVSRIDLYFFLQYIIPQPLIYLSGKSFLLFIKN